MIHSCAFPIVVMRCIDESDQDDHFRSHFTELENHLTDRSNPEVQEWRARALSADVIQHARREETLLVPVAFPECLARRLGRAVKSTHSPPWIASKTAGLGPSSA